MKFELTILGCGSALPTVNRNPTAQFVECNNRYFLIDCAEGTQLQLRRFKIKFQKIDAILISHLHGDHYFGLVGLISTFNLLGRDKDLLVIGPEGLEQLIRPQLEVGGHKLCYNLTFKTLEHPCSELVFEDKKVEIYAIPLKHRIPTHGYLIREKVNPFKLDKAAFDMHGLQLQDIPKIKNGELITTEKGELLPSSTFLIEPKAPKSYAYCSDTKYEERIIPLISNVELLYHEATFTEQHRDRAKSTFHSTAGDAALIAQKAQVKQLILGHFSSRYTNFEKHLEEAQAVFERSVLAEDGMVVRI